jgi:hypothetical protein
MIKFVELQTKKARVEFLREKVASDDRYLIKGLIAIFECQTQEEKVRNSVSVHNGIGFSRFDVDVLSEISKKLLQAGALSAIQNREPVDCNQYLTPYERNVLRKRMQKYVGQLARIAEFKTPLVKRRKAA